MTLEAILRDSYRRLGYKDQPEGLVTSRLMVFADEAQREILREPDFAQLLRVLTTFTSVANQAEYGLPLSLATIESVRDVAAEITLLPMSEDEYRRKYPDPSRTAGRSFRYVPLAVTVAGLAVSASGADVFIKSTAGADTQTAYWTVITDSGEVRSGSVPLAGSTAISLFGGTVLATQIVDLVLSQAANGTVTAHLLSGAGVELLRISQNQTKPSRRQIALVPTPTEARTYTVIGQRHTVELSQANDEPVLPPRFHPMIGVGIRKREFEVRGNMDRWAMADKEWQGWLSDLRRFLDPTHGLIVPGGLKTGWSSLGATFPAEFYR